MAFMTTTQRFVRLLIVGRWPLLAIAALIAVLAYWPAQQVRFDRSIERMFAQDDPLLPPYERLKARFGGNEIVLAVYADDEPVGFVMAYRDPPDAFWVWRFMIDAGHQGKGYGHRALELLVDEARQDGVAEVKLSYHPGEHSPHAFYTRFGFLETGEVEEGEVVMRLPLG